MSIFNRYKKWLLLILTGVLLLQLAVYLKVQDYNQQILNERLAEASQQLNDQINQSIAEKHKATTAIALTMGQILANEKFANNLSNKFTNFDELVKRITLYSDYKNLWVQILTKQGESIYRNWTRSRENVAAIRTELPLFDSSLEPIQSISVGKFDLALKVTAPIVYNGNLLGFIDLISHFNSIQKHFEEQGVDSVVLATQARSKSISSPFSAYRIGAHYVANLEPNPQLFKQLDQQTISSWLASSEDYFVWQQKLVLKLPLIAPNDKVHGYYLAFQDVSSIASDSGKTTAVEQQKNRLIVFDAVLTLVLLMGLAIWLLRSQKHYYQAVLNSEEEAVLVTNGIRMLDGNAQLFKYFPELKTQKKRCVCDFFIEKEGYLQKQMGDEKWLDYLLNHPDDEHHALMDVKGVETVFRFKVQKLGSSSTLSVVVLTDITNLITLNKQLNRLSLVDELTGAGNRRAFHQMMEVEQKHFKRYGTLVSVILFDIDHFKRVNDTHGHQVGDEVLQGVTRLVKETLRDSDKLYRIGGEEYIIILSGHNADESYQVAERLRVLIAEHAFNTVGQLTISLGVAELQQQETQDALMKRVDDALYQAKNAGRNQTVKALSATAS